jgi:hypothetical protein
MGAASSILASYADVMRVGGNIFCTQKIFTNNSNFRPQSTLAKTTSTAPALNTSASPMKQQDNTTDIKKEDDNEDNEGGEDMENEEKENKLAA